MKVRADVVKRDAVLVKARAFIEREYRRSPDMHEVARVAGLSPYHFHRRFRRKYGKTPKQIVQELRIAELKRLIRGGMRLDEAACTVGFSQQSHMTSIFKRLVGVTPARWGARYRRMRP